ncbi:MAG: hypothetical protein AAFN77_07770 [Planctomycetota bacterium]
MTWFQRQDDLNQAIARGDLELALELFQKRRAQPNAKPAELLQIRQRLTQALMGRASSSIAVDNLVAAWRDLSLAGELATSADQDLVSKEMSRLVELTIENSESMLLEAKTVHALQLIHELSQRQIMDWRVDRILEIGDCIQQAEQYSAEGKFAEAVEQLETAYDLQPELEYLQAKIKCKRDRNKQLSELTKTLQSTALSCQWNEVNDVCEQILKIAPRHEIAIAAKKHSLQQMKRRTSAGSRITNVPLRVDEADSFFEFERSKDGTYQSASPSKDRTTESDEPARDLSDADSFLIWVDGVGGYLVCTDHICLVGQAVDGTTVAIPLQADLRQRHARIELVAGQHLVQPLGFVTLDGKEKDDAFVLKNGQILGLGNGVRLKYVQTHPLSKTSRLDFVSRHRTLPWSDGVLLASQSIVLGPNRNNHVFCPRWKYDLIFFCRGKNWFCRRKMPFIVDGQKIESETQIRFDSHIQGDDFSLTLEPVFRLPPKDASET